MLRIIFLVICINVQESFSNNFLIQLRQGTIEGRPVNYIDGSGKYRAFLGIPYAQPPVKELRFKPPVPVQKHEGIMSVKTFGSACVQKNPGPVAYTGSENCLFLNVYTDMPENTTDVEKIPVMFFIYGGGYSSGDGSSDMYGPDYFLKKKVILVTINYRLGVFGFLTAPDLGIYGNMGLKDQRLALRWVYENIEKFGGDKNRITIFGESAGGASVNHLLMDPTVSPYISGAILQSGCALNSWDVQFEPAMRCQNLTNYLKITNVSLDKLQNISTASLINTTVDILPTEDDECRLLQGMIYVPTKEDPRSEDPILTECIQNKIERGELPDIPIIIGFNSGEGIFAIPFVIFNPAQISQSLQEIQTMIPRNYYIWENPTGYYEQLAIRKLKELYGLVGDWNRTKTDNEKLKIYTKIFGDYRITNGIHRTLKGAVKIPGRSAPIYFYRLSDDSYSVFKTFVMPGYNVSGVSHQDDLGNLFTMTKPYGVEVGKVDLIPEKGKRTHERMITMWTNFAKTGNPTSDKLANVTWNPISEDCFRYLDIANASVIGMPPYAERHRMRVWDEVLELGRKGHEERTT